MADREGDERSSIKNASIVMLLISLITAGLRFVVNAPFFNTIAFEISLVYVPTVLLVGAWLLDRTGTVVDPSTVHPSAEV